MRIIKTKVTVTTTDHEATMAKLVLMPSPSELAIEDVIARTIKLNTEMRNFWSNANGWAPIEAAGLLSKARLDWQVSLTICLRKWAENPTQDEEFGHLILAWTNLGSLVEGGMKLFLSVWFNDYKNDINVVKKKGQQVQEPDTLSLEPLRQFFRKKIWNEEMDDWILLIQQRRNAIHAFKSREIGSHAELTEQIRRYLTFVRYINLRLPYPGREYTPSESYDYEHQY